MIPRYFKDFLHFGFNHADGDRVISYSDLEGHVAKKDLTFLLTNKRR